MHRVKDSLTRKKLEGWPEPAGVILVLEDCRPDDPDSLVGKRVSIRAAHDLLIEAPVAAVRDHGPSVSILIAGLNREIIPIGSEVRFLDDALEDPLASSSTGRPELVTQG